MGKFNVNDYEQWQNDQEVRIGTRRKYRTNETTYVGFILLVGVFMVIFAWLKS